MENYNCKLAQTLIPQIHTFDLLSTDMKWIYNLVHKEQDENYIGFK
jgi:hypothetical protein